MVQSREFSSYEDSIKLDEPMAYISGNQNLGALL
jgi:hypothetical protein